MTREDKDDSTKERLLNEGESLFARKGYAAVSVREITTAAECNLAAVNYHFGNKQTLYLEVFRARWVPRAKRLRECFERSLAAQHPLSPTAVVQALAQAFLEGPLTDEERLRHGQAALGIGVGLYETLEWLRPGAGAWSLAVCLGLTLTGAVWFVLMRRTLVGQGCEAEFEDGPPVQPPAAT